jgi:hypothetical protein
MLGISVELEGQLAFSLCISIGWVFTVDKMCSEGKNVKITFTYNFPRHK